MEQIPAVITPMNERLGLDIARSLGRKGIPVYGLSPDPKEAGGKSKYCQLVVCPDPKKSVSDYVQFMVDWGQTLPGRAVLYPISDMTVVIHSRERQRLAPYYECVMPDHAMITKLLAKEGLIAAAQECDVPAPRTITPQNAEEVEAIATSLVYPVILKPIQSHYWHIPEIVALLRENPISGQAKVWLCQDASELVRAFQDIARYDSRMIVQEVIPGPDENLFYISFYLDRQSRPLALFAGRKWRVLPIGFGSACYVRSFHDPNLEQVALQFLSGVRYQGLGGLEFKLDSRDGLYKLIEFNTRFGLWDGLGAQCGVDTAYIAYRDALHLPVEPQLTYREGVLWIDLLRDTRAFLMYRQRGQLTLGQWLRSWRGEKMWTTFSRDDWRPGVAALVKTAQAFAGRIISKRT